MHFGSRGKIFEHRSPEVKIGVWRTQIEEDQDPDGPWRVLARLLGLMPRLVRILKGSAAKMAANCAQDELEWRQDGHLGLNLKVVFEMVGSETIGGQF
jgi:hypothetical protein